MAYNTKAWYENCYISVAQINGAENQLCARTTNLSISGGDFDIEGINTFCGKVTRVGAKNDIEITMDGIPVSVGDFDWLYHGVTSSATSITSSAVVKNRVIFLWTDQASITSAAQAITTSSEAFRRIYAEAYCTSLEYNMDAGEQLTATINFKLATEDANGSQNYKLESCDTTSALTAVSGYTTASKF